MSVLFVAAEAREFSGLLGFCANVRKLAVGVHWARQGVLKGRAVTLVANGAGAERAAAAVRAAPPPEAVVSTGFCGAVVDGMEIGTIFCATEIDGLERRFRACVPPSKAPGATGRLATLPRVLQTAREKEMLRERGASAVDMEAAGVAREAEALGIPLFCVRAVTDLAHETFQNDFNSALRGDGHFDTMHLLRAAALEPASLLPELIRLGRRSRVAARALGEFLADCRF